MIRRYFVWLHRWVGLSIATFLVIEGLTGSILAFRQPLSRLFSPQLFASAPGPHGKLLDLATLAERAETLIPQGGVGYFARVADDQVVLRMHGRKDPSTGEAYDIGFKYLVLDPWTGNELGRLKDGFYSQGFWANIIPFVLDLHISLNSRFGDLILSIVALVWSVDCFVGFYLTLPSGKGGFWRRWNYAWLVKWRASAFRINFDLHRAGGLWFWFALFIFAWSSTNLTGLGGSVYDWVTGKVFPYQAAEQQEASMPQRTSDAPPLLDWRAAQLRGAELMSEEASKQGFLVETVIGFTHLTPNGLYVYTAQTNRRFPLNRDVSVYFDGDTGALYGAAGLNDLPDDRIGNKVTTWLRALHMISDPVDYMPYRIYVFLTGLVIALLSVTGVYIWWKKRTIRLLATRKVRAAAASVPVASSSLLLTFGSMPTT